MILACHNINKSFGDQIIVKNGSFHIEEKEKAALIGINGAGKSTILKMLIRELTPDSGEIIQAKDTTIGYLSQHQELTGGNTILEEIKTAKADVLALEQQIRIIENELNSLTGGILEERILLYHRLTDRFEQLNGYACQSEIIGVLKGLGFSEEAFSKEVSTLSGGEKTRVALGKLLLTRPDILLLDEPTNHLDMNSIRWLENYLINYNGAVLIVSHDRYFLNRVVTKVVEIEQGVITCFSGNYTTFSEKKKQLRLSQLREYTRQQAMIEHQEAVIEKLRSFNREKSIKRAESREKALSKMEIIEKPQELQADMHFTLEPSCISGNDVLKVQQLAKSFEDKPLFSDVSFEIRRGEHVAVIGNNGTGKTTLLKIFNHVLPADAGSFETGSQVKIGYYDQEHHVLHMEKTIFDEISDDYPHLTQTKIRNVLAAFLFTGDDVYKKISDLSGGERGRVSLAKLMLSEANFLILDEPTNHLDINSKEILEQAINDYTGTVLYVSHDRYFINQTATRILELKNQNFINYIGNYDYYEEKRDTLAYTIPNPTVPTVTQESENKTDWKAQKEEQARIRKRQNDLKKTEEQITDLESQTEEIDTLLSQEEVYTNSVKCQELSLKKAELTEKLEELYEAWAELAD